MKIVILTYIDRSGSTFLANKISKYPEILVFPEAGSLSGYLLKNPLQKFVLKEFSRRFFCDKQENQYYIGKWPIAEIIHRKGIELKNNIEFFIELLKSYAEKHNNSAGIWLFKQRNIFGLTEDIINLNCTGHQFKYVCILRDPRAVYNSQYKASKAFPELTFYSNPLISAHTWLYFYNRAVSLYGIPGYHIIYYEQLILQYKKVMNEIIDFIGFNKKTGQKEYKGILFEQLSETGKKLHSGINDGPDISRIYAWKKELTSLMIKIVEHYTLKRKYIPEYKATNPSVNIFVRIITVIFYKIRIILSIDRY